ncbi:MAG: hypoxanthine phosphoribosyltransferase [Bacteroidota bacterium]|jgi:hypoxanthine phosphoribosyltransferase
MNASSVKAYDLHFEVMIDEPSLTRRVQTVGQHIAMDYQDKIPVFLCVLNGSFIFAADLVRAAGIPCDLAFVRLASYEGTSSTGTVRTVLGLDVDLENRDVIILEDIVDTGRTLHQFVRSLEALRPASVRLAVLLLKPDALRFPVRPDYLCFAIDDVFVVGYGLDYNGRCRNLPAIYQRSPATGAFRIPPG